jgi:hypothetical protein
MFWIVRIKCHHLEDGVEEEKCKAYQELVAHAALGIERAVGVSQALPGRCGRREKAFWKLMMREEEELRKNSHGRWFSR